MSKVWRTAEREIRDGRIAPVYLIVGDEAWGKKKFLDLLKSTVVDPSMSEFNFDQLQANETSAVAVIDKARVLPMMADRRMIVVDGCEQWKKKDQEALVRYFEEANEQCVLVLLFLAADQRTKLFRTRSPAVRRFDFLKPKRWELNEYIRDLTVEMKLKLNGEAIALVAEMVGDDLTQVHQELEKLSLYKMGSNEILPGDVTRLMGRTRHVTRWELNEYIGKRDLSGTLMKMHDILDSGEEPIGLLSAINLFIKQLLVVKALMVRGIRDQGTVARELGLPNRIAGILITQQKSYSGYELRRAFKLLKETDRRLKSAGMNRRLLLDHLLTQILAPGPLSPPRRPGSRSFGAS